MAAVSVKRKWFSSITSSPALLSQRLLFFFFFFFLNWPDLFLKLYCKAFLALVFERIKKKRTKQQKHVWFACRPTLGAETNVLLSRAIFILILKVKWTKKLTYFLLSLYLHQTLKRNILSEIWVKIFLPKPI